MQANVDISFLKAITRLLNLQAKTPQINFTLLQEKYLCINK